MARIEAIYISPVKSLALMPEERVHLTSDGIPQDRRFFLVNGRNRLVTQREYPALTQIKSRFDSGRLRFEFPNGAVAEDTPGEGDRLTARFFGKYDRDGYVVAGPWSDAISKFAGAPLRLVRAETVAFDVLPVSICSAASVDALRPSTGDVAVDERRFRPNFYISGVEEFGEDAWIGREVRIGGEATVRVRMRDGRCEMTTHNPETGERDLNTLRIITNYRTDQPKEVNFGVYGTVTREGNVGIGDTIEPI